MIDQRANEIKRVNFYKFHNPPAKKENIMKHKEARVFRTAVSQRVKNVWVNLKINIIILYQHNNLKPWVREDKNTIFLC